MNSLRAEKAYVSWSHDVSRDDTPLEAGLCFAVAWDTGAIAAVYVTAVSLAYLLRG